MIIELKTGTLLAQLGQVAFSTGASTLPQLGRFYAKRLSNKFILQYPYSYLQDSADLCNSCRPNSIHLIPFRLTISKRIRDAALYTFVYHYTFAAKSKSLII